MKNSANPNGLFRRIIFSSALLILLLPVKARAEVTVMVEPSSAGGLLVSAGNLYGVKSGEIRLDYQTDGPAVTPSVVVLGNNTQATLNSTGANFGTVIISITGRKPANGYVYLARINMVDQDGNPGRIISPYYARFTKDNGGQETARVNITNPSPTDKKPDDTKTAEKQKTAIAEAVKKRQQEISARADARPNGDTSATGAPRPDSGERSRETVVLVASSSQPPPAIPSKLAPPPSFRRMESVLDRFRNYTGEWNPDVIGRLFAPITSHGFHQQPAVMIADGKAEVQVAVRPAKEEEAVNCFVIRGGQVTSIHPGEAGEWFLDIVPWRGSLSVTVTVLTEQNIIEYPLTVAPSLELFDATAVAPGVAEFVQAANDMVRSGGI